MARSPAASVVLASILGGIATIASTPPGTAAAAAPHPCLARMPEAAYRSIWPVKRWSPQRIRAVLETCEAPLKANPTNHRLILAIAALSYHLGDKARAHAILWRADLSATAEGAFLRGEYRFNENKSRADLAAARRWFLRASELGHARAAVVLGYYAEGAYLGTQDYKKALSWYRLAAKRGDGEAHFKIGIFYDAGWGVKRDRPTALEWYRKASELGVGIAAYHLGEHYRPGMGEKGDPAKAMKWYARAGALGYAQALVELGKMYRRGSAGEKNPDKARELFRRAAAQGAGEGYYELASELEYKHTDARNFDRAVALYFEGAKLGHPESMTRIAMIFEGDTRSYREDVAAAYFWHTAMWYSGIGTRARVVDDEKLKLFKGYLGAAQFDRITKMAKAWEPGKPLPARFAHPPVRER